MLENSPSSIEDGWIVPDWPAPTTVKAFVTTRGAALQAGSFGAFNTADHVRDDPVHVQQSRAALRQRFAFLHPPLWLDQVHGTDVVVATARSQRQSADAVTTLEKGLPITIHTADCLPLFFCNRSGTRVALAHAGWRGLAAGVIENTVQAFHDAPGDILVWLGPAIGPSRFEVGNEVREAFLRHSPHHASAFQPSPFQPDGLHWLCDLYRLTRQCLAQRGIFSISGGAFCTASDERFFSYRRDNITGRMLSIIWLEP